MWTDRLFGQLVRMDCIEEPLGLQPACAMKVGLSKSVLATHGDQLDDTDAHATILELLGSHLNDGTDPSEREGRVEATSTDGNDLLGSLYAHYCRALDMPQSLISGAWVSSGLPVETGSARDASWQGDGNNDAGGAISDMFGDIECVDHAFGTLRPGTLPDMHEPEAVPEILRLFAPPEYMASARIETVVMPALTQREHHALAIDSPLVGLNDASRKTETENQ